MSIRSILVNYYLKKTDRKRDKNLTTPYEIKRFNDLSYGPHEKWHLLDIYHLKTAKQKLPVIINVHGGGWVYGTKETYQFYGMDLAKRGFIVVNFNYRLAPKYKFPAQLEDINHVVSWIFNHQNDYLFDLNHIYFVGDSAGAHLISLYMSFLTDKNYQKNFDFKPYPNFMPQAIALNCGLYDLKSMALNREPTTKIFKDFLPKKTYEKTLEIVNASHYINAHFPPVFLMTASHDFLKEQSILYEKLLKKHQVPYVFKIYGNQEEKREHVFHCQIKDPIAIKCNDETSAFLHQF